MYHRKYFSGAVQDKNLTRSTINIANNSLVSEYYVRDEVVCQAIKETLEEAGIACTYDSQNSTISIDGLTVQFLSYMYVSYIYFNVNGQQVGVHTTDPFNGNSYKFYVTLKGDIKSVLLINIGYYSAPAYENLGIAIGKGVDIKDQEGIHVVSDIGNAKAAASQFYIVKNDEIFADYKIMVQFGQQISNVTQLNGNGTDITLVECVAKPGRFKIDNCYFGPDILGNDEFFNIGGAIYYKLSNSVLVKCTNEQTV